MRRARREWIIGMGRATERMDYRHRKTIGKNGWLMERMDYRHVKSKGENGL